MSWKDQKHYETRNDYERKSNKYKRTYMDNLKELYKPSESAHDLSVLSDPELTAPQQGLIFKSR